MPDAPEVLLPTGADLGSSFEYGIDIDIAYDGTNPTGTPDWQPIRRISDLSPTVDSITSDVATYDDFGAPNVTKTSESASLAFTVLVNRGQADGKLIPELEALKKLTEPSAVKAAAVGRVRYYHKPLDGTPDPDDAYELLATCAITRANSGNADTEKWSVTLTGKGKRTQITNPFTGWETTTP